jgi:AraC family transcriptional regulator of adaptative response / methylphosphotriester-DNA alkyltransferase methyltransferase
MLRPDTIQLRTTLYEEAVTVLREEYASPLTVRDLAERVSCSCRQLQRAFHDTSGESFRSTLTAIRMDEAARILLETPVSVRETAQRVGYRQPAQFAKAFRRHHGVAPSQFRIAQHFARIQAPRGANEAPRPGKPVDSGHGPSSALPLPRPLHGTRGHH